MFGKIFKKAHCVLSLAVLASLTTFSFADNINVNGTNRTMNVYAPRNIEKNRPLIIQMHGMNQDAPYQQNAAKWEPIGLEFHQGHHQRNVQQVRHRQEPCLRFGILDGWHDELPRGKQDG